MVSIERFDDPAEQIVLQAFGDLGQVESACNGSGFARIVDENASVDLGCLRFEPALEQQIRFVGKTFQKNRHRLADRLAELFARDRSLCRHHAVASHFGHLARHLRAQVERRRPLLVRIEKNSQVVEADVLDETHQFVEVVFSLSRKADNERGAQTRLGDRVANAFNLPLEHGAAAAAPHELEDPRAGVLIRDIEVVAEPAFPRDFLDQSFGQQVRVAVEQPDPIEAFDAQKPFEQFVEVVAARFEILPVCQGVLGHDDEFPRAPVGEPLGFIDQIDDGPASEPAPKSGNGTEGASVVASLRYFQVSHVRRRGPKPRNRGYFA